MRPMRRDGGDHVAKEEAGKFEVFRFGFEDGAIGEESGEGFAEFVEIGAEVVGA